MTITNKSINIVLGTLLLGMLIMWRCERQNALNHAEKEQELKNENDILLKQNESIKSYNDSLKNVNKFLRDETDSIFNIINDMSKDELRDLWSKYRHNLRNSK